MFSEQIYYSEITYCDTSQFIIDNKLNICEELVLQAKLPIVIL